MEKRIAKGHIFMCKKDVVGSNHKVYYRKGHVYECVFERPYPTEVGEESKNAYGFIINDYGSGHAWAYDTANNPISQDKWSDYFTDLGEKPHGLVITQYEVGDTVKWFCYEDYSVHKSKIISISIEVVKDREPIVTYYSRIRLNGNIQEVAFSDLNIHNANK